MASDGVSVSSTTLHKARRRDATDLAAWRVEQVAPGTHMVTARNLHDWFGQDPPDESTLEQARAEFGNMILRPDTAAP